MDDDLTRQKLTTNGSNLPGLWEFAEGTEKRILEIDDIYSNDIYAMLKTYGVEMARAAILREMKGIFGVYNIDVNRRHLELIADYMVTVSLVQTLSGTRTHEHLNRHLRVDTSHLTEKGYQRIHRHSSKPLSRRQRLSCLMRRCMVTLMTSPHRQETLFLDGRTRRGQVYSTLLCRYPHKSDHSCNKKDNYRVCSTFCH